MTNPVAAKPASADTPAARRGGAARLRVAAMLLVIAVGGCQVDGVRRPAPAPNRSVAAPASDPVAPAAVRPGWREVTPPAPQVGERFLLRDVVGCAGRWYLVGAVADARGGTRPAAWSSGDGASWVPVPVQARSYYGRQNVLWSAACGRNGMAALGAKSGGAHGNPRHSSWRLLPGGVLSEVTAPFELFGGPEAVNVARVDAGEQDWLISGNRMSGAAVWVSADGAEFRIVQRAPGLASGGGYETWASDAVATPEGWLVVGGELAAGRIDRDAVGWRSADARAWQRMPAAATAAYEELQRVVLLDGVPVAAGLRGGTFGAWRLAGGGWQPLGGFGAVGVVGPSGVRALSAFGGRLFCVTADGTDHAVWISTDRGTSWRAVAAPTALPARADQAVAIAGIDGRLVLAVDDGGAGRVYAAETGW